jgi:hypothetical protein
MVKLETHLKRNIFEPHPSGIGYNQRGRSRLKKKEFKMKKTKYIEKFNESLNRFKFSEINFTFKDEESYEDNLSDFMFEITGMVSGGLPNDVFTDEELEIIETNFKNIYDAKNQLTQLIESKL